MGPSSRQIGLADTLHDADAGRTTRAACRDGLSGANARGARRERAGPTTSRRSRDLDVDPSAGQHDLAQDVLADVASGHPRRASATRSRACRPAAGRASTAGSRRSSSRRVTTNIHAASSSPARRRTMRSPSGSSPSSCLELLGAAEHRDAPAGREPELAHERRARVAGRHAPRGQTFFMPCTGRPSACHWNSVMHGRLSSYCTMRGLRLIF